MVWHSLETRLWFWSSVTSRSYTYATARHPELSTSPLHRRHQQLNRRPVFYQPSSGSVSGSRPCWEGCGFCLFVQNWIPASVQPLVVKSSPHTGIDESKHWKTAWRAASERKSCCCQVNDVQKSWREIQSSEWIREQKWHTDVGLKNSDIHQNAWHLTSEATAFKNKASSFFMNDKSRAMGHWSCPQFWFLGMRSFDDNMWWVLKSDWNSF